MLVGASEAGPLSGFTGHGDLGTKLKALGRFVATFNRAKVNECVEFLTLPNEARGSALFAAKPHLNVMPWTLWGRRFVTGSPKDHIHDLLHDCSAPGGSFLHRVRLVVYEISAVI